MGVENFMGLESVF